MRHVPTPCRHPAAAAAASSSGRRRPGPGHVFLCLDGGLTGDVGAVIGRSWFNANGSVGVSYSVAGPAWPSAFGPVVSDTGGAITCTAFDGHAVSLGGFPHTGFQHGSSAGGTAGDRSFGATRAGAVASIRVVVAGGRIELNHLQYRQMAAAVPKPGTWALMPGGLAAVGRLARRRGWLVRPAARPAAPWPAGRPPGPVR